MASIKLPMIRRRSMREFARDEEGATAIEFTMISVPFFGILFAIFETGFVFFAQQGLQSAVAEAARKVMTGAVQVNGSVATWQTFRDTYVCPSSGTRILPSFVDCSKLLVDVESYTDFSTLSTSSVNSSFITAGPQYLPGCPNQIVIVRAAYPMPVYLPLITQVNWNSIWGGGTQKVTTGQYNYKGTLVHMLTGASVFKNEPFPTSGTSCS